MAFQKKNSSTYLKKIKFFFIRKTAKLLIFLLIKSCRLKITGFEGVKTLREANKNIVYVYWHRHIFVTIYRFKNTGSRPLISLSEDGEIIAQIALEFGMDPIRGSSSKGGARALLGLVNAIKEKRSEVLITADGPKGPVRQIKDGTILLAQKTQSVIVPICWHASGVKIFRKTWDQFKIPLPFSSITYAYGQPVYLPKGLKKDQYSEIIQNLKNSIDQLEFITEKKNG